MFTGIIEEVGTVRKTGADFLEVAAEQVLSGTAVGDSIAVNGVCLTVTRLLKKGFAADVMPETFRRSNLGSLTAGSYVNLERAMAADGRFGGHLVSGHIDGTGRISGRKEEGNAVWITVDAPPEILLLIVEKGSVALDGISLTVAGVEKTAFSVSVIPHTGAETTLLKKRVGDRVNLENDIIGKYVQRLLSAQEGERKPAGLTREFLTQCGY